MSEERFRLDARAQASQRRARRITLRVILVVGVLNAASWAVWGTPWRPYDRMFLLLGMAGQLRFHAEGSPPRMSPDSTSFAYALLTQEYSGQPMPLSAWQGPDLHEVSRKFEIYIRDLRPGGTSRLVAAWDLRPKEEAFLASWEPQGLAVTGVFGVRDWGVLVDPRTGARWPILGRVNNWSNRHFVTRHEMVWEEDDPRAPHVELIADRYEAWDPAKRVFTVVAEIPAGRDGYLDPEGAERRRYREEREYADGVQQVSVVHGRVAADSAVIEIVTTARQPAAGSRDYDLLGTIEIPDVARERPF